MNNMAILFTIVLFGAVYLLKGSYAGFILHYGYTDWYPYGVRTCHKEPGTQYVALPPGCEEKLFNVGTCHRSRCRRCDGQRYCCTPVAFEMKVIECKDRSYKLRCVTECECQPCKEAMILVTGNVMTIEGEPLSQVKLMIEDDEVAVTDLEGAFDFHIYPPDDGRLVLNFADVSESLFPRFFSIPKVLRVGKAPRSAFDIHLPTTAEPLLSISGVVDTSIDLDKVAPSGLRYIIRFPSTAVVDDEYAPHSGSIVVYSMLIDRDESDLNVGPTELFAEGKPPGMLSSFGMFKVMIIDAITGATLHVTNATVSVDAGTLPPEAAKTELILWALNKYTGYFEEEGEFQFPETTKRSAPLLTIDVDDLDELGNLDVVLPYYCYLKVGVYTDKYFTEEIVGATVFGTYLAADEAVWSGYISEVTQPNTGACVPIPCNGVYSQAETVHFSALHLGEHMAALLSSYINDSSSFGVSEDIAWQLEYRRGDEDNATAYEFFLTLPDKELPPYFINGPIYDSELCRQVPLDSSEHFRFFAYGPHVIEFNTVYVDEHNFDETWSINELDWWPSIDRFCACYIKIRVTDRTKLDSVVATSWKDEVDIFGSRHVPVESEDICLEYRCSMPEERTLVVVESDIDQPAMSICSINSTLSDYLNSNPPIASNNPLGSNAFWMFAPVDSQDMGIYKEQSDVDPLAAKMRAYQRCMEGEEVAVVFC